MARKAVPGDPLLQEVLADFAASQRIEVLDHFTGCESSDLVFRNLDGAERGPTVQPRHPLFFAVLDASREACRQGAELWLESPLLSRLLAETSDSSYAGAWSHDCRFFNGVRVRGWAQEGDGMHWLRPKPGVPTEVLNRI